MQPTPNGALLPGAGRGLAEPLLRLADVCALLQVSRITIWTWRREREFPEPIRLSAGCIRWRQDDIDEWIRRRSAA